MAEIPPLRMELKREKDGRSLASVQDLPGVMACGATEKEAVRKARSTALHVLAEIPETELDQVAGCLRWDAKPKTLAEMDAAVEQEVIRRHKQGRY